MKGRKPALQPDPDALDDIKPPGWLSSFAKAEWDRVLPELSERRILTAADLGSLENYCIATGRVRELEYLLRTDFKEKKAIDPKIFRMQDKAMTTARQLAAELGLTPVSRSRPAVRDTDPFDDDDENPLAV